MRTSYRSPLETDRPGQGSYREHLWLETFEENDKLYNYTWPLNDAAPVPTVWTHSHWDPETNYTETYSGELGRGDALAEILPWVGECRLVMSPTVWQETWDESESYATGDSYTEHVARTITSDVNLWTGSDAVPGRKSLFRLSAEAEEYRWVVVPDPEGDYGYWETNWVPATPPIGDLFEDGKYYVVLADGESVSVMPEAPGNKDTKRINELAKLPLKIKQGLTDLTDKTTNAIVGQQINLTCELEGMEPTSYQWDVPGYAVAGYNANANTATVNTNIVKTNSSVSFYWVDGGSKEVRCAVKAGGQQLSAKTTFNVTRPSARITPSIYSAVTVDFNWEQAPALHFGVKSGPVGIRFSCTNVLPGQFQWVQVGHVVTRVKDGVSNRWYRAEGDGLDTSYPYPKEKAYGIELDFADDSPGVGLVAGSELTRADSYTMHLMFKPSAASGPQWVPLRKVSWNWGGHAILTNGNWGKVDGNPSVDSSDSDCTQYPVWQSNITNSWANFMPE